ncbi:MAG: hypothetical protein NTW12_12480 [Deltaproteobacteria bacterium]|nr:hypothetical protein [Deltaproteobacteria bacterium]
MGLVGVKYCGGCNPHIDRAGLVRDIEKLLPPGHRLTTDRPPSCPWETAILVCGCEVKCAHRPAIRSLDRRWILVGGSTVDLDLVPEGKLAGFIVRKKLKLEKEAFS